jgi:hypothetical protein
MSPQKIFGCKSNNFWLLLGLLLPVFQNWATKHWQKSDERDYDNKEKN